MSPLLFSLFINDIELYLQGDTSCGLNLGNVQLLLLLFADDMVILSENPNNLQNSLNKLLNYCNKWGLEVNTEKTKLVVFRKKGALRCNETWYYNGKKLEVVNDFHYLGATFSHTGSFNNNTRTLSNKALKAPLISLTVKRDILTLKYQHYCSYLMLLLDRFYPIHVKLMVFVNHKT